MDIAQAKTADLIPYGFNNRIHSQEQVDRIANSITQFGFNQPIVVDENNIILVGHGRYEAAKKLSLSEVPVLKKTNLSETEKRAYRILDNKLQNDSEWEFANLKTEFDRLVGDNYSLDAWGLTELKWKTDEILPNPVEVDDISLPDGEKGAFGQKAFNLTKEQMDTVDRALLIAKGMGDFIDTGNENANGNALSRICETFITQNG